jgi:Zn-dependent protease
LACTKGAVNTARCFNRENQKTEFQWLSTAPPADTISRTWFTLRHAIADMSHPASQVAKGSFRLFHVWGIDVQLHWTWLLVAYFEIKRPSQYTSILWNAVEYLSVFGIVLLHEFGHVLACRQVGGRADRIVLWPLGGIALVQPPPRPAAFLWSLAAGPLVNVVLVPVTLLLLAATHFAELGKLSVDLDKYVLALTVINASLLVFNLLPIYPLDGGQILYALLWFVIGRGPSLKCATVLGVVLGLGLLASAFAIGDWWLCVLSGFAILSSFRGFQSARLWSSQQSGPMQAQAACPACRTPANAGESWCCSRCRTWFDVFSNYATCPTCSSTVDDVVCHACGHRAPFSQWSSRVE